MNGKTSILIVDDDSATRKLIEKYLVATDFELEFADTLKGALNILKTFRPDIAVIDYFLPDGDGGEFCETVRTHADRSINSMHILGITARKDEKLETRMLNKGADDFILKPFSRDDFIAKVNVGKRISGKVKQAENEFREMFAEIDVLLIQDGGCAPGYNPVTAYLTNYMEGYGRRVYCSAEGYKSIVNFNEDSFFRLIYDFETFKKYDHIRNVFNVAYLSEARGAEFRSERFPQFAEEENQKKAASTILAKKVNAIVAIGGNGTFYGIRDLMKFLPNTIQLFFVPVTIDSDVSGTETIGEHTGVELGAEKIRAYLADARTHKRIYIIEMMGARGGYHALHSCIGSRAHLAVLPGMEVDYAKVAMALSRKTSAVIVVAEGYREDERKGKGFSGNAAEYFLHELNATKIPINRKIVCEPFSRDIRGAAPNNLDITLAQRMAYNVAVHLDSGNTRLMPAIEGFSESVIPFSEISTDNQVKSSLLRISNRLYSPK